MATYYTRQGATAAIGAALADRGWRLVGYKPDRSDGMTDYFDPAAWDGIARRDGLLLLCDVSAYYADRYAKPQSVYGRADGPCSACGGTGRVQHDSPGYVSVGIFGGARNVTPARRAGDPCDCCDGTGHREEHGRIVGEEPAIPHVRKCPGRWMVIRESDGRILGTGQRPLAADRGDEDAKGAVDQTVRDIEEAAEKATARPMPPPPPTPKTDESPAPVDGDGVRQIAGATVRPSTVRPDFVEVCHPSKPSEAVRDELKRAGFRWSGRSVCWYGPADRLPARYAEGAGVTP